jgi:hypothetical protein
MVTITTPNGQKHEVHTPKAVHCEVGGIWFNGLVEIAVYTKVDREVEPDVERLGKK